MLIEPEIKSVLTQLKNKYRQRSTALNYGTPFQLLISTMLAAQSTDVRVNIVTRDLFPQYPDAVSFLKLTQRELEKKIQTVGLYKSKAKHIRAACRLLVDEYGGHLPSTRAELMRLPGVGRKTANVVLSIATGFDAIAVDTHVFRVSNRIGLADAADVRKTEQHLMQNIPKDQWSEAHHWLIWHGREICKERKPACATCFLTEY